MTQPPIQGWIPIQSTESIPIPGRDGKTIVKHIEVEVPAWRDPASGEVYLDSRATALMDQAKARHMGILLPDQLRRLRESLDLTQEEICELLQLGGRTWSRWENGRERPSRSINVLLCALFDGKIDLSYLRSLVQPESRERREWQLPCPGSRRTFVHPRPSRSPEDETLRLAS